MSEVNSILPVPGYEGYFADNCGVIYSNRLRGLYGKGRIRDSLRVMSQGRDFDGYPSVSLRVNGKVVRRRVHVLVLLAFRGTCPDGLESLHLDDCKTNNVIDNLAYGTHQENMAQRNRAGHINRCGIGRKISPDDRVAIKHRLDSGESVRSLAVAYQVSTTAIRYVRKLVIPTCG